MNITRLGITLAALCALLPGAVLAKPVEREVNYNFEGQAYRGFLAYEGQVTRSRPLVIMVPNWLGTTERNRQQARAVAGKDYVVFLADMYGADRQPSGAEAAGQLVKALYSDRKELRARAAAAKAAAIGYVKENKLRVDVNKIAAVGFCFGGATALEMARTGDNLAAVVSFHGNLSLDAPVQNEPIKARILALHGDADPYVPPAQVEAFEEEMRKAGADWQLVRFGGAVHSFTDPTADSPGQSMYHAKAARRAFAMMRDFLAEAFAAP